MFLSDICCIFQHIINHGRFRINMKLTYSVLEFTDFFSLVLFMEMSGCYISDMANL